MAAATTKTSAKPRKLTAKQMRFVDEYLIDLNATQAAIRAGYSPRTSYSIGVDLLKKPEIQALLQKKRQKLSDKLEVSQEKVIKELAAVAFANGADYAKITAQGLWKCSASTLAFSMASRLLKNLRIICLTL